MSISLQLHRLQPARLPRTSLSPVVLKLMSTITNYTWPKCRRQAIAVHLRGQIGFVCFFIFLLLFLNTWFWRFDRLYLTTIIEKKKAYSLYTNEFVITGPQNWKTQVPLLSQVPGSRNDAASQKLSRTRRQRKAGAWASPQQTQTGVQSALRCSPVLLLAPGRASSKFKGIMYTSQKSDNFIEPQHSFFQKIQGTSW